VKQIIAFIRQQRFNRTRTALADAGFSGFTARKVVGRGRGSFDTVVSRAGAPMLLPCRMLSIVVPDADADAAVRTIIGTNKTGVPGDGKIFVLPVLEALRIRTREQGDEALSKL
jgi:nitrogen regulatory protein PII 2